MAPFQDVWQTTRRLRNDFQAPRPSIERAFVGREIVVGHSFDKLPCELDVIGNRGQDTFRIPRGLISMNADFLPAMSLDRGSSFRCRRPCEPAVKGNGVVPINSVPPSLRSIHRQDRFASKRVDAMAITVSASIQLCVSCHARGMAARRSGLLA